MSSPSETDIAWLAGLLEGEGSFGAYGSGGRRPTLRVYLEMSDEDVVVRARKLMLFLGNGQSKATVSKRIASKKTIDTSGNRDVSRWSDSYYVRVHGAVAEAVMRVVRPYMGRRRGERIDALLAFQGYSHHPRKGNE